MLTNLAYENPNGVYLDIPVSDREKQKELAEKIANIDLDPIKIKLMDLKEGLGWSRNEADLAELKYKRFLYLVAKYPDKTIVPSKEVDHVWHSHILDTMKYEKDCLEVFGYFLHHFPYLGMRSEEDAKNLSDSFEETKALYSYEFKDELITSSNFSLASPSSCNSNCNNPKNCSGGTCNSGVCEAPGSIHRDLSRPKFDTSRQITSIFN